jgi:hypothetical protein
LPFSVAIFVRRFSEMGDMMRKIFVSATVTAALCLLAISVAPALGLEFEGEATYSKTSSTTAQTIQLGAFGWVECAKMEMTASPKVGAFTTLGVQLEKYTTCSYHHGVAVESVSDTAACTPITLESADLEELAEEEFGKGRVKVRCEFVFKPGSGYGCQVEIWAPRTALPEYEWINLDGTPKRYASLIHFKIEGLEYEIREPGSIACKTAGDSGSDGDYVGSMSISYVIVPPVF